MSDYVTSWSDNHLSQLSVLTNHKIIYDGYEYRWLHFIDGEWSIHSVKYFEDYKQPYSWIRECVYRWSKELQGREARKQSKEYYKIMFQSLEIDRKIFDISKEHEIKTFEKIKQIKELRPEMDKKDVAELLDISVRSVERYLKKLKQ